MKESSGLLITHFFLAFPVVNNMNYLPLSCNLSFDTVNGTFIFKSLLRRENQWDSYYTEK